MEGLSFRLVVMFVKELFMIFAIISSVRTISLFSAGIMKFTLRPSSKRKQKKKEWFFGFPEFFDIRILFD